MEGEIGEKKEEREKGRDGGKEERQRQTETRIKKEKRESNSLLKQKCFV